jgi:hypothetical protein
VSERYNQPSLLIVGLILMSIAALAIVVGLILFPTSACKKPSEAPPLKEGKCEVTSYKADGSARQQWCQYKGYWWVCDEDGDCSQGKPLPAEVPK